MIGWRGRWTQEIPENPAQSGWVSNCLIILKRLPWGLTSSHMWCSSAEQNGWAWGNGGEPREAGVQLFNAGPVFFFWATYNLAGLVLNATNPQESFHHNKFKRFKHREQKHSNAKWKFKLYAAWKCLTHFYSDIQRSEVKGSLWKWKCTCAFYMSGHTFNLIIKLLTDIILLSDKNIKLLVLRAESIAVN